MFSVIALFLAPLGPVVVAGHQIALNVVSLLFMLPLSLGMALTLRVSFLIGAGAPTTARRLSLSALDWPASSPWRSPALCTPSLRPSPPCIPTRRMCARSP